MKIIYDEIVTSHNSNIHAASPCVDKTRVDKTLLLKHYK